MPRCGNSGFFDTVRKVELGRQSSRTGSPLIVFIHFVFTIWGCMNPFLGLCYVYMNLLVLSMGLWSIAHHESSDSVLMMFLGLIFTILQDIILLSLRAPKYQVYYEGPKVSSRTQLVHASF